MEREQTEESGIEGDLDLFFESLAWGWESFGWDRLHKRAMFVLESLEFSVDGHPMCATHREVLGGRA